MKRDDKMVNDTFNLAVELYQLKTQFPEKEQEFLLSEMIREAIAVCACMDTVNQLQDEETTKEFLPKAYTSTFLLEVMLELSKELNYIENIGQYLKTIEQVREELERRLGYNGEPESAQW